MLPRGLSGYQDDVDFIVRRAAELGVKMTENEAYEFWSNHSDDMAATWLCGAQEPGALEFALKERR